MTALKSHKFINPAVTGKKDSVTIVGSKLLLAQNRIGATVFSIGEQFKAAKETQVARKKWLLAQDRKDDQAYRFGRDQEAENQMEGVEEADKASNQDKEKAIKGDGKTKKKAKSWLEKLFGPFLSILESIIKLGVVLPALKWISEPENRETVERFVDAAKIVFGKIYDFASGSVGLLLDGISAMFDKDKSGWDRFKGFLKVLAGVAGLIALKALFNPIGLMTTLFDAIGGLFDMMTDRLKKPDADTKKPQDAVERNRQQNAKARERMNATQRLRDDMKARYGFKNDEQLDEFIKRARELKRTTGEPPTKKQLQSLSKSVLDDLPATALGKMKKEALRRLGQLDELRKKAVDEAVRLGRQAVDFGMEQAGRAKRAVTSWAADQWKNMMKGANTVAEKWKVTQAAMGDLAGKAWNATKDEFLKRAEQLGGPLQKVIKALKGPVGERIMKYIPYLGDILMFGMDVINGIDWRRALIRSIAGAAIDAGATALIGALVAATPLTGGASTALAIGLTAAYMAADAFGDFRTMFGDPIADMLGFPMYSGEKGKTTQTEPNVTPASEAKIAEEQAKIVEGIGPDAIAKVQALSEEAKLQGLEAGGRLSGNAAKWAEFYDYGKNSGAKFPEVVSAQFALESGWGKHLAARNNFFGLKGVAGMDVTVSNTREVYGGQDTYIDAPFVNFDTPLDSVKYLTKLWYKDYKGYKGINNAGNAIQAAAMLKQQGYATDPVYAESLQRLIRENKKTTEKVAKGSVTYPEGTYMSPSSGSTGLSSGSTSAGRINGEANAAPQMSMDQMISQLSSQIAQINSSRSGASTSSSVAPAAAPSGADVAQSSGQGAIEQAITDVKSQVPQLILSSIPNPIPINIGSTVQTVYTTITNPMAMAKTVLGGLF